MADRAPELASVVDWAPVQASADQAAVLASVVDQAAVLDSAVDRAPVLALVVELVALVPVASPTASEISGECHISIARVHRDEYNIWEIIFRKKHEGGG